MHKSKLYGCCHGPFFASHPVGKTVDFCLELSIAIATEIAALCLALVMAHAKCIKCIYGGAGATMSRATPITLNWDLNALRLCIAFRAVRVACVSWLR